MIRSILIGLGLSLSLGAGAMPPPPPSPEMRAAHLARALALSEAQYDDVLTLLQAQAAEDHSRHCRDQSARQARRDETDAQIASPLTTEQQSRFVQLQQQRPAPPPGRGPCGPRPSATGATS